jgi:uncharacterized protein YdaU (DUF1376 family)
MEVKKNTGKAPSIQFYYKDFLADMQEHSPEIVGAWMLILIKIWHEKMDGEITKTIEQFAKIMHTSVEKANEFIDYFSCENIADVTRSHNKITVVNRRTKRDAKLLEQNRLRQQRHRGNAKSNADVTPKKVNPSSSSSTSIKNISTNVDIQESTSPKSQMSVTVSAINFTEQDYKQIVSEWNKSAQPKPIKDAQYHHVKRQIVATLNNSPFLVGDIIAAINNYHLALQIPPDQSLLRHRWIFTDWLISENGLPKFTEPFDIDRYRRNPQPQSDARYGDIDRMIEEEKQKVQNAEA